MQIHTAGPRTSRAANDVIIYVYTDTSTEQWYKYIQHYRRQHDYQHYLTCIFDTDTNTDRQTDRQAGDGQLKNTVALCFRTKVKDTDRTTKSDQLTTVHLHSVCMYIYIYICTCMYECTDVCVCIYVYVYMYMCV